MCTYVRISSSDNPQTRPQVARRHGALADTSGPEAHEAPVGLHGTRVAFTPTTTAAATTTTGDGPRRGLFFPRPFLRRRRHKHSRNNSGNSRCAACVLQCRWRHLCDEILSAT